MADAQDLSALEQQIMKDYGQYITVPLNPAPTYKPSGLAAVINPAGNTGQQQRMTDKYNQSLQTLTGILPNGVSIVDGALQIYPGSELYNKYLAEGAKGTDLVSDLYSTIRSSLQPQRMQGGFSFMNSILAKKDPAYTERQAKLAALNRLLGKDLYRRGGGNIGGFMGMGNNGGGTFGMGGYNPTGGSTFGMNNNYTDDNIMASMLQGYKPAGGLVTLLNARKPAPSVSISQGTNELDDALQAYANVNHMTLDQVRQKIANSNAIPQLPGTIADVNNQYYATPATPVDSNAAALQALQNKYYAKPLQYAKGGEVDSDPQDQPFYDANNPDFAAQVRANVEANPMYAGEPPAAPVQVAPQPMSSTQQAINDRRALLNEIQRKLNEPLVAKKGMSDAERNWRLAAAFGKQSKFGTFGESLVNAAETLADIEGIKRAEQQDLSAQELARLQAKMGVAQQQYEMSREEDMRNILNKYITKGEKTLTDAAGNVSGAADEMGVPSDVAALITSMPTEKAVSTLIDLAKERNKPSDLIKGVNFLVKSGSITEQEGNAIIKQNLTPKFEMIDVNVPELGGTVQMSSEEARKYSTDGTLPGRLSGAKTGPAPGAAVSTQAPAPAKPVKTKEQLLAEQEGLKEQAKKDIEQGDTLLSQKSFADQQIQAAKEVSALAKKNPKAFGLLADPTASNAILSVIDKGVSTPWGSVGVAVEEPLAKLKLTGPEAQARQTAVRPVTMIEVGYRKMFLKGEGAVSNMEGELVKYIGPQISDKPEVMQLKAGMVQIGAEKQKAVIDAFEKYKEKNPAAGPRSFYQTPAYKNIVNTYEKRYYDFAKSNGVDIAEPSASKGGSSLVERLRQERARRAGGQNAQ